MNKPIHLRFALAAMICGAVFLIILTALHFLEPEFDPSWRMISEYELGKFGWLMSIAFCCWAGGFFSISMAALPFLQSSSGKIAKWWYLIISLAHVGASIFYPQAITDTDRGSIDKIHSLCGFIMIFTLPIASIFFSKALLKHEAFQAKKIRIWTYCILLWIGLISFITASTIYHPVGRNFGPENLIGWPNRLLVVCYTIWLIGMSSIISKQLKKR